MIFEEKSNCSKPQSQLDSLIVIVWKRLLEPWRLTWSLVKQRKTKQCFKMLHTSKMLKKIKEGERKLEKALRKNFVMFLKEASWLLEDPLLSDAHLKFY